MSFVIIAAGLTSIINKTNAIIAEGRFGHLASKDDPCYWCKSGKCPINDQVKKDDCKCCQRGHKK